MASTTVKPQGNTFSGSVSAGMSSLFNPNGRKYYILEHKVSSRYHHQGETQEIIVDTIELGRDARCQVRYDETFSTVSRRHAAIVRDGDNWKLVQLSKTNTTFLNGKPVKTDWYLQNGDEIQLAVNGPKLGFIIPTGSKATVGSIGLTRRLSLFRQQAMRPYKTAIASLCALIVILSGVGGYFMYQQHKQIMLGEEQIAQMVNDAKEYAIKDSIQQAKIDSLAKVTRVPVNPDNAIKTALEKVKPFVYYVETSYYIHMDGVDHLVSTSIGSGFLLSDGRFVTARHCVQPWIYRIDGLNAVVTTAKLNGMNDVYAFAKIEAQSMNDRIVFNSSDFVLNDGQDKLFQTTIEGSPAYITTPYPLQFEGGSSVGNEKMLGTDWAYARVNRNGGLSFNSNLSKSLKAGTTVHVLGFPSGLGKGDGDKDVEPIYNRMSVSRDDLNSSDCIMVTEGVAHGNSGGPVFAYQNGQLEVVAIVSRKESATQQYGMFGITQQQQQYDQLVPISNMK